VKTNPASRRETPKGRAPAHKRACQDSQGEHTQRILAGFFDPHSLRFFSHGWRQQGIEIDFVIHL
jgi:hypothetical protein